MLRRRTATQYSERISQQTITTRSKGSSFLVLVAGILLLGTGLLPAVAAFQIHDFLDHIVTLQYFWAKESIPFHHFAHLPTILGGSVLPAGALGIPDFSPIRLIYSSFPLEWAVSISDFLARALAGLAGFSALRRILGFSDGIPEAIGANVLMLMPYYPSMSWNIAGLAITSWAAIRLGTGRINPLALLALFVAPQLGNLAWGSWLCPLITAVLLAVSARDRRSGHWFVWGSLASISGFMVGAIGLIRLELDSRYVSHRTDFFGGPAVSWSNVGNIPSEFVAVFLAGQYHFAASDESGAFWQTSWGISFAVLTLTGIVTLVHARSLTEHWGAYSRLWSITAALLLIQFLVALFFLAETQGVLRLSELLNLPFQFNRVIALTPLLWAGILATSLALFFAVLRGEKFLHLATALVLTISVGLAHPTVGGSVKSLAGFDAPGKRESVLGYFRADTYEKILRDLPELKESRALSYGLDPMVAVQAGIPSVDGYVYNYPIEHKRAFRDIIYPDASLPGGRLSYYDSWGSRLYLFRRDVAPNELKFDWGAARRLGVEFLLANESLSKIDGLDLIMEIDGVFVHRLLPNEAG